MNDTSKVRFGRTFTIFAWILAFLITIFTAYFQRVTGPTYPVSGSAVFQGKDIFYEFERSGNSTENLEVEVPVSFDNPQGTLLWKRHGTQDDMARVNMVYLNGVMVGILPAQPPLQKLDYQVRLINNNSETLLPPEPVTIRFKDEVPAFWLGLHILAMFGAMLLSSRTGVETFRKEPKLKKLTLWTLGVLTFGGFIMGAVVLKYAFDVYWTGFPVGMDITDNKTLISWVAWLIATIMVLRGKNEKMWVIIAAVITLVIFLVPHSIVA